MEGTGLAADGTLAESGYNQTDVASVAKRSDDRNGTLA